MCGWVFITSCVFFCLLVNTKSTRIRSEKSPHLFLHLLYNLIAQGCDGFLMLPFSCYFKEKSTFCLSPETNEVWRWFFFLTKWTLLAKNDSKLSKKKETRHNLGPNLKKNMHSNNTKKKDNNMLRFYILFDTWVCAKLATNNNKGRFLWKKTEKM